MAAELVTDAERALEIEIRTLLPEGVRRPRQGLGRNIHREPIVALVDDGKADARAADRCTEINACHWVAAADFEAQVRALLRHDDGADVADDPGEHYFRLARADPLVNFEPVHSERLLPGRAPSPVGIGNRVQTDIAEA